LLDKEPSRPRTRFWPTDGGARTLEKEVGEL
jgi:hypothetical protein